MKQQKAAATGFLGAIFKGLFGSAAQEPDTNARQLAWYRAEVFQNVKKIGALSVVSLVLGLIFAGLMGGWRGSVEGVAIVSMAALACYLSGSMVGFIFSIPRSAQAPAPTPSAGGPSGPNNGLDDTPRDNTNLEQISDWFVKILIGAGITQLAEIKALLAALSAKLSASLVVAKASAGAVVPSPTSMTVINSTNGVGTTNYFTLAANAAPDPANLASPFYHGFGQEFCLFLILYFLVLGFLTGYLITRVWLPYVLRSSAVALSYMALKDAARKEGREEAKAEVEEVIKDKTAEVTQQVTEKVTQEVTEKVTEEIGAQKKSEGFRAGLMNLGMIDADKPPHADGGSDLAASDPHKGQFGGVPEANGLKLSAEVKPFEGIDDEYFRIHLKVARTDGGAFTAPVTFHLHPTFTPDVVTQSPVNNEAVLERVGWGGFTVGAVVKDEAGHETKLELDLAELPDAPDLFKSR
jgi:hypothetical protein